MKANFKPQKAGAPDNQHLAGDELEDAIFSAPRRAPRGEMVQRLARAVGAPTQTVRYRLSQLAAAGIILSEWDRRFLYYRLNDSGRCRKRTGVKRANIICPRSEAMRRKVGAFR